MSEGRASLWHRLYNGETSYDFIGKSRRWFVLCVPSPIMVPLE